MSIQPRAASPGFVDRVQRLVRPVDDILLREPMREGRLTLEGVSLGVRALATLGLVALFALVASMLLGDLWRRGDLVATGTDFASGRVRFVPVALVPVSLFGMHLAWLMVLSGALFAWWPVRIAAGITFLLTNAVLADPLTFQIGESFELSLGPPLVRVGYFATGGLAIAAALLPLGRRWGRAVRGVVLALIVLALTAFYGGHLLSHAGVVDAGLPGYFPRLLDGAFAELDRLVLPMVVVSFLAVVEFSHSFAEAVVVPAWRAAALVAKLLVAALIVTKLVLQVDEVVPRIPEIPVQAGITVAAAVILVLAAFLLRRIPVDRDTASDAEESLIYVAAATYLPLVLMAVVVSGVVQFIASIFNSTDPGLLRFLNYVDVIPWVDLGAITLLFVAGVLVARRSSGRRRELGIGMAIIGGWALPPFLGAAIEQPLSPSPELLDVLLTAVVGVVLLMRWTAIDTRRAVGAGALVLFMWLVGSRGEFIEIVGGLAGFPASIVIVFGVFFTLATGSAFARRDSRRFPRPARLLIWLGYWLVSLAILNWLLSVHGTDITADLQDRVFRSLAIPLAAWWVFRQPFAPPEEVVEEGEAVWEDDDEEVGRP